MTTKKKIEVLKEAIAKADNFQSGLQPEAFGVPFLGSLKIRALLNNLGAISTNVMDIGCHKGGSLCSMLYGNNNIKSATAIDCWASDQSTEDKAFPVFEKYTNMFRPAETVMNVIISDCWQVDLSLIPDKVDLYSYDAGHSETDQYKALEYYLPVLTDTFIYCCDDYGWKEVKDGTQRAIKDLGLKVLFEQEFITDHDYDNDSWWDGYATFLLQKK